MTTPISRRRALQLSGTALAAPAILSLPRRAAGQSKQTITYGYLLDPAYDATLWAIRNGRVTSDLIDIQATGLVIPSLIQATSTKQFDVVMTAVIAVPAAAARGLDLRLLSAALVYKPEGEGGGLWVRKDSPITNASQLKGRKVASYGLRSTGWMYVRDVLHERYGLNIALEGGDFEQLEVAAPNLPTALGTGQVDAAALIHSQAWRASQTGEFVNICDTSKTLYELHGQMVAAVNAGFPERISAHPEAYQEFCRMVKASSEYALANQAEVFGDLAKKTNLDPAFFTWWFGKTSEVPGTFTDGHARAVDLAWHMAKTYGLVPSVPDVKTLIWEHAIRA
jgi:NitT/TauT family transport system substrate-binding protein